MQCKSFQISNRACTPSQGSKVQGRFLYDKRVLGFFSEMFGKLNRYLYFFFRLRLRIRNRHKFSIKREAVSPQGRVTAKNPSGQLESNQTHTLGNGGINLSDLRV